MPCSVSVPVTTASRSGRNPAEAVWWLHRHPGSLLRLIDLPDAVESLPKSMR